MNSVGVENFTVSARSFNVITYLVPQPRPSFAFTFHGEYTYQIVGIINHHLSQGRNYLCLLIEVEPNPDSNLCLLPSILLCLLLHTLLVDNYSATSFAMAEEMGNVISSTSRPIFFFDIDNCVSLAI
jgi:hypothetical protein